MQKTLSGLAWRADDLTPQWQPSVAPVFLHHGIGVNHHIWDGWIPALSADRQVIRNDMRGWGRSPVPPENHNWTMEQLVTDVWQVIDAAQTGTGPKPVHLFGESFGGSVILAAALDRPDQVASVTLSNASFRGKGVGEFHNWPDQFADGPAAWSARMMENRFAPGSLSETEWTWFHRMQSATHPHVATGQGRILAALDLTARLPGLSCPLRIIMPDRSPFVPVSLWAEQMHKLPHAELRVVPGVRHGLPFSHARSEARNLATQLKRLDNQPS